jgi:hypothetical protein
MTYHSHCAHCRVRFYDRPEDGCPNCGGPIADGDLPRPGERLPGGHAKGATVFHLYPECVPVRFRDRLVAVEGDAGDQLLRLCGNCRARRDAALPCQSRLEVLPADAETAGEPASDAAAGEGDSGLPAVHGGGVHRQQGREISLSEPGRLSPLTEPGTLRFVLTPARHPASISEERPGGAQTPRARGRSG